MPATAEPDRRPPGQAERFPFDVYDFKIPFDPDRTILEHSDFCRHSPMIVAERSSQSYNES